MRKDLSRKNLVKAAVAGLCVILTGCGTIGLAQEAAFESAYENVPGEEVDVYERMRVLQIQVGAYCSQRHVK